MNFQTSTSPSVKFTDIRKTEFIVNRCLGFNDMK